MTTGPWYPGVQHGGPVAALLARSVEFPPAPIPVTVVRLTVELLRPILVIPLRVETEIVRAGRRVQLVAATIRDADSAVARAVALRIRTDAVDLPVADERPPPGPESGTAPEFDHRWTSGYLTRAVDVRFVAGSFLARGPGTAWVRLRYPIVTGEDPSPLARVAAAADFGNGIANELSFRTHIYINPDLTIYLHRPAAGEWVCLDAVTRLDRRGVGVAESTLWDEHGRIGSSAQALLVEERE